MSCNCHASLEARILTLEAAIGLAPTQRIANALQRAFSFTNLETKIALKLYLKRGDPVPQAELFKVFTDADPNGKSLHVAIWKIRRKLGAGAQWLPNGYGSYSLSPAAVDAFDQAVAA